jgi:hypothetical protein
MRRAPKSHTIRDGGCVEADFRDHCTGTTLSQVVQKSKGFYANDYTLGGQFLDGIFHEAFDVGGVLGELDCFSEGTAGWGTVFVGRGGGDGAIAGDHSGDRLVGGSRGRAGKKGGKRERKLMTEGENGVGISWYKRSSGDRFRRMGVWCIVNRGRGQGVREAGSRHV